MTVASPLPSEVGSALSLQELAYSCEHNPPTPDKAESLQYLVASALKQGEILQLAWSFCTRDGEVWEAEWYTQRVRVMEFLANIVVDILARTRRTLAKLRKEYPDWEPPGSAVDLDVSYRAAEAVLAKVKETRARLTRPTPPVDMEMIRRSRERPNRGQGERIGDVIARLESGGSLVTE
jgi:hypothetical protein